MQPRKQKNVTSVCPYKSVLEIYVDIEQFHMYSMVLSSFAFWWQIEIDSKLYKENKNRMYAASFEDCSILFSWAAACGYAWKR